MLAFELLRMVIKTFIAREESQPNRKGRLRITRVLCKEGHTTLFIFFAIFEQRIPVKTAAIKPSQHAFGAKLGSTFVLSIIFDSKFEL
jgi:hypothetical protein